MLVPTLHTESMTVVLPALRMSCFEQASLPVPAPKPCAMSRIAWSLLASMHCWMVWSAAAAVPSPTFISQRPGLRAG